MGRFTNENIPVGRDNADNITETTNIVSNVDGSVLERLEALQNIGSGASPGIDYYVNSDTAGDDTGDGLSWATAKQTIGAAVAKMVDNDNCYVGGTSYSEAVTTPTGVDRCKLISVHNSKQSPLWQSGAGGSSHLAIIGGKWEVSGFRFHGGDSNTVAFLEIDTSTPLVANGPYIHDCYFTVGGATGPAIRFHGGCYDPIVDNCEFFGFTADNTGGQVGTLCGSNHANSTQNPIITNNTFTECVNAINMQCSDGLFKGNNFGRIGKTNDCTTTMHLIHNTLDDGTNTGDGANIITQNTFDWDSSELTQANGFWFSDTDMIVGNFCRDGVQSSNDTGIGKAWYVDSASSSDTRTGHNWSTAFTTIQAAVTACSSFDTIYCRGGASFEEAVTIAVAKYGLKLIGVSDTVMFPTWKTAAVDDTHLTINAGVVEVHNFHFYGANHTVPFIIVDRSGGAAGAYSTLIKNCWIDGAETSDYGIRYIDSVQNKLIGNYIKGFDGTAVGMTGTVQSAQYEIRDNMFFDNVNHFVMPLNYSIVKGNNFQRLGYINDATIMLDVTGVQHSDSGTCGGNCIIENYFGDLKADINHANGYYGVTSDQWLGNYCIDGLNTSGGLESSSAVTNPLLGRRIERTKSDLMDGTTTTVFTIAGGDVLITALYGTIEDAAHAGVGDACKFQVNPTTGSATDLCATSDLTGVEEGTMISVNGISGTNLVVASSGNVPAMLQSVIAAPGILTFVSGGNDTNATKLQLNLWYFPLEDGATIVVA